MDVQMVISVRAANTPFKGHDVPVAVSCTNISPFSHAVLRDRNLVNDLERFASLNKLRLDITYLTCYLLHLLLTYQATCEPRGPAAVRVRKAIDILETAWKVDIKEWSQSKDFTIKDPITGEVIWNTYFVQFINLILQPMQTRSAYVFFDENGDISEDNGLGIWRQCQFKSYPLNGIAKTFELHFQINKQKKGLVLDINDIQKFDRVGIRFEHPTDPDCVLFNPFCCNEFAQPRRHDSNQFMRRVTPKVSNHYVVLATRKRMADYTEVLSHKIFSEEPPSCSSALPPLLRR
jgi:hypothetical protein